MESRKLLPSLAVASGVRFLDFLAWPFKELKSELVREKDAPNAMRCSTFSYFSYLVNGWNIRSTQSWRWWLLVNWLWGSKSSFAKGSIGYSTWTTLIVKCREPYGPSVAQTQTSCLDGKGRILMQKSKPKGSEPWNLTSEASRTSFTVYLLWILTRFFYVKLVTLKLIRFLNTMLGWSVCKYSRAQYNTTDLKVLHILSSLLLSVKWLNSQSVWFRVISNQLQWEGNKVSLVTICSEQRNRNGITSSSCL